MRVLIGSDATRAIETESDEFRNYVIGAIFSDVVKGSAYADYLDLLEEAIDDSRNKKLEGFSPEGLVKEMKKTIEKVDEIPIRKLIKGQSLYAKFEVKEGDIEKPFTDLKLSEILDDDKIKRLLGFRQLQRPPEIKAGQNGFITSSYLKEAISDKRGFYGDYETLTPGQTFSLRLSESNTANIDGSKVDYLQKEGYSPYLTDVSSQTDRKFNLYEASKDRTKVTSYYSQAVKEVERYPNKEEVVAFFKLKPRKNESVLKFGERVKKKTSEDFYTYLATSVVRGSTLLQLIFEGKGEEVTFEGMDIFSIIENPDKFLEKIYPNGGSGGNWYLYDMLLEIEVMKEKIKISLEGKNTHDLFKTGLVSGKGSEEYYKPEGFSVPLGTQRKSETYRKKLRDFAAVIRNNYLELMEV